MCTSRGVGARGGGSGGRGEDEGARAGLSLSPQQSLLTMEEIDSVEETQVKERKCILLRIRGGKQFVLQCDVSVPRVTRWGWPTSPGVTGHPCPGTSHLLPITGHFPPGCQLLPLGANQTLLGASHLLLAASHPLCWVLAISRPSLAITC